jgi:hypothetical protein
MGSLPGGPFGQIPHYPGDPTEALVNAQLSSTHAKASSSSQGPLPFIAPKPRALDFGSAEHYQYFGPAPGAFPSANPTDAPGSRVHQQQYFMGQMSPDAFFAQQSNTLVDSPVQMSQPSTLNFYGPLRSPNHPLPPGSMAPAPIRTDFGSMNRSNGSPILPISPPFSQPASATLDVGDVKTEGWPTDEEDASHAMVEDRQSPSITIEVPGLAMSDRAQATLGLYGTQETLCYGDPADNVLANYAPSPTDTPLNNPQTAQVFWYFVTMTAPSLSMYERNTADPSRTFSGDAVPTPHRHIWTCE